MRIGRAAVETDTGRRRLRNEDAYVYEPPLFAIADGMGGARAGEIAAGIAASALGEAGAEARGAEGLAALITEANRRIWERSLTDPETAGMGTTVTVALVDAPAGKVTIGHVGDSRAYRARDGVLEQLTTDHSLVAELVESGILTREEADRHPQRSAITRALGTEPTVDVDAFTVDALAGDLFLLCSDGLSDMLSEEEIAAVIIETAEGEPARAAGALVVAANARGGQDNVTVVLFELVEDDEPAVAEPGRASASTTPDGETSVSLPTADAASASTDGDSATDDAPGSLRRHGAGPGSRLAALLLLVTIVGIGLLALYWGLAR